MTKKLLLFSPHFVVLSSTLATELSLLFHVVVFVPFVVTLSN